jgi:surface antigen
MPELLPVGSPCGVLGPAAVVGSPWQGAVIVAPSDCQQAQAAATQMDVVETGQTMGWTNQDTGASGSIVATADPAPDASGHLCRPFTTHTTLSGGAQTPETSGIVCRSDDGDWAVQPAA